MAVRSIRTHDTSLERLRSAEFQRLDRAGSVYLDYTGSALYPESLVRKHGAYLADALLGNPHSHNPAATTSTEIIETARQAVLDFFDADPSEYVVCFTANASAAFKLVAESFPFAPESKCVLTTDNHNSINGIREFVTRAGGTVEYLPLDAELRVTARRGALEAVRAPSVFAFPAQSNFSGVQPPLGWIREYQQSGYRVMLDAAAFVPSNPLSLREWSPDFVGISFYKMFGYPTGIGALIAKRAALDELRRPWFAGGTVDFVSIEHRRHQLLLGPQAFEDGTPNFAGVVAVPMGLQFLRNIGMERIRRHVHDLTDLALTRLAAVRHGNGQRVVRMYGPETTRARGSTVAFNVQDGAGRARPYWEVESAAADVGISIRGGCFCNPGASEAAFNIDPAISISCLNALGPGEFTPARFSACLGGEPVGAVRASFGVATNDDDIDRLVEFVGGYAE